MFLVRSRPWLITVVAAMLLMVGTANWNTFGVFFKPIAGEFGWSRSAVSGTFAMWGLVMAAVVAPVGYWSDRHGPRAVLLPSFLLFGISFLLMARVTTLWHLFLVQGLLMGMACAGPFVCLISTVGKWHDKRRGLAMGIAAVGTGLSAIVFPPLAATLIQAVGWRGAAAVLGLVAIAIGVPGSMVMKNPPAQTKGQLEGEHTEQRGLFHVWRVLPHFLKNPTFLAIFLMFSLNNSAGNMMLSHFVNYVTDAGIIAVVAASMMSSLGIASTAGRLTMGVISDRIGNKGTTVTCFAAVTAAVLLLGSWASVPAMWVSAVIFGFGHGGQVPMITGVLGERFGTKHLAMLTGMVMIGTSIGNALGSWLGGFVFDISSSYKWALNLSAAFAAMSMVLALRLRPAIRLARGTGQASLD